VGASRYRVRDPPCERFRGSEAPADDGPAEEPRWPCGPESARYDARRDVQLLLQQQRHEVEQAQRERRWRREWRVVLALFLGGMLIGPPLLGTLVSPTAGALLFILAALLLARERF
jgi:hypothetical protein